MNNTSNLAMFNPLIMYYGQYKSNDTNYRSLTQLYLDKTYTSDIGNHTFKSVIKLQLKQKHYFDNKGNQPNFKCLEAHSRVVLET